MTNGDKLKKFLIEELGVTNIEDFGIFDNTKAGSKACEGFICPEELRYSKDKCGKCKYNSFWERSVGDELTVAVNALNDLKKANPELKILMETPKGNLTCKIKNALIYESMDGKLAIDAE